MSSTAKENSAEATLKPNRGAKDTIYALSSGAGVVAGVAIIRISGPEAESVLKKLIAPPAGEERSQFGGSKLPKPRMACVRRIYDPETKEMLDESLVLWFPGPGSFTGEDTVELHVHGSRAVVAGALEALAKLNSDRRDNNFGDIRLANRGEFTQRAFENGRMDLTEVEGLADLIAADTAVQRRQALRQMGGALREKYQNWREELKKCLAHTEAVIDFGDDEHDVSEGAFDALRPKIGKLLGEIQEHLEDGKRGEIVRTGIRVAILGPPNAGKSTLLNYLAQRPAAIVSPIAGTTRDVVEVQLDLGGLPIIVCDTAGLREATETGDIIEIEGMKRARAAAADAHLAVFVVDLNRPEEGQILLETMRQPATDTGETVEDLGLAHLFEEGSVIIVGNKRDLFEGNEADLRLLFSDNGTQPWLVSCDTKEGMDELLSHIEQQVHDKFTSDGETAVITRERHRYHLQNTKQALESFLQRSDVLDLAAEELRIASQQLGCIIGVVDVEEILDVIFNDFCIGK